MSSYGNHVWTPERDAAARNLIGYAMNDWDDDFAEALHLIAGIRCGWPWSNPQPDMRCPDPTSAVGELLAVMAILAERCASQLLELQPDNLIEAATDFVVGEDWQAKPIESDD
jgi:hypothetical protein